MRRLYAIGIATAALIGVCLGVLLHSRTDSRASALPAPLAGAASWPAGSRPAPAFALHDQDGRSVSIRSFRGRPVLLAFMDSRCTLECPLEGHMLAAAVARVPLARRPRVVIVSVDPWGDTRATAKAAIAKWQMAGNATWLLGTHAELAQVWRAYRVTVVPVKGDILHSTPVYVIDRAGDERAGFLVPFEPAELAGELSRI